MKITGIHSLRSLSKHLPRKGIVHAFIAIAIETKQTRLLIVPRGLRGRSPHFPQPKSRASIQIIIFYILLELGCGKQPRQSFIIIAAAITAGVSSLESSSLITQIEVEYTTNKHIPCRSTLNTCVRAGTHSMHALDSL